MTYKHSYKRPGIRLETRNRLIELLPFGPGDSKWNLLHYLLLGKRDSTNKLPVPHKLILEIEGIENSSTYRGASMPFLEVWKQYFSDHGIGDLNITEHHSDGRTRTLYPDFDNEELKALITDELNQFRPVNELVDFKTGRALSERRVRREAEEDALANVEGASQLRRYQMPNDIQLIHDYLNERHKNLFTTALNNHFEEALELAYTYTEQAREKALDTLTAIKILPKPFYKFGDTVLRLSPVGYSLVTVAGELRGILTKDWIELDLKNAQIAVLAMLWGMEELIEWLRNGNSWWDYLFQELGEEETPQVKDALKTATYSLCFGMKEHNIKSGKRNDLDTWGRDYGSRFIQIPWVRKLLIKRDEALEAISRDGQAIDAYERAIDLDSRTNNRSVLASVAQSYEQKLIAKCFQHAQDNENKYKIVLYQYDGFSIKVTDNSRRNAIVRELQQLVEEAAIELNIPTRLEAKPFE